MERTKSVSDPGSPHYDAHSPYYDVTADSSSSFYVGPLVSDTKSGDEIRAEVVAEVEKENAGHSDWLSKIIDPIIKDQKIQDRYEQKIDQARQGLADGLDLRATDGAPSTVWANATHEQMNEAISQNADSATVAAASEEWVVVGNELADHQQNLAEAISASTSNWQGAGGDAAREHLANVGKWLGSTAQGATLTGHQQQIHSQALNETQKQMGANPPVAFSVQDANARLQTITDPVVYAQAAAQEMQVYKEQQAARGQAAQVMTQFDGTVGAAVSTPAFPPPPKLARMSATAAGGGAAGGGAGSGPMQTPLLQGTSGSGGAGAGGLGADGSLAGGSLPGGGLAAGMGGNTAGANIPSLDASGGAGGGAMGGAGSFNPGASGSGLAAGGFGSGAGGIAGAGAGAGAGSGAGGSGAGGAGGSGVPNMPALDFAGLDGASYTGGGNAGAGTGGVPPIDGSTTASGYAPSSSSPGGFSAPGLHVPPLSDGTTTRGGSAFPAGGTVGGSPISGGSGQGFTSGGLPTIGRSGGVNGTSIGSRLSGLPGPIEQGGIKGSSLGGALGSGSGSAGSGLGAGGKGIGGIGGGGAGGGAGGGLGAGGKSLGGGGSSLSSGSATGGALAAEEAAAARAAAGGAAGAKGATGSGMGGMGPGAGGKGKGDDDKEHRLADYLEADDPSIFAPDEAVAPPVIGDWKNTDWK
jgi:hypothetical protein